MKEEEYLLAVQVQKERERVREIVLRQDVNDGTNII